MRSSGSRKPFCGFLGELSAISAGTKDKLALAHDMCDDDAMTENQKAGMAEWIGVMILVLLVVALTYGAYEAGLADGHKDNGVVCTNRGWYESGDVFRKFQVRTLIADAIVTKNPKIRALYLREAANWVSDIGSDDLSAEYTCQ